MKFLVSKEHRAVVFSPPDPQKVLSYIPTAKALPVGDGRLLAMPYRMDETRMLRNLDVVLPSPIGYFYDWPREHTLIAEPAGAQIETAGFLTLFRRNYCLNGIGTGKTISALWAADFLMREGLIRRALIVSPLSTLESVWADSVFFHLRHRTASVLHGTGHRRRRLFAEDRDFYIVNHDGLDTITESKLNSKGHIKWARFLRDDIDLVIIDELAVYRSPATNKIHIIRQSLRPTTSIWGLTGTPTPQQPYDAWAQCKLITPETVPDFFTTFREQVAMKLTATKWVARPDAMKIVYEAMRPAIRFTRDEVFTLPGERYEERVVELSAEQKKHYKEMQKELYTEIQGGRVTAANEGVKIQKLVQTACGVVYDREGRHLPVDCGPRLAEVRSIIEQCGEKVIVFAPLEGVVNMLHKELSKHWTCETVYGGTSKAERDRIFGAFQRERDPRVLVAHPQCMAHGLTLTEASTIIWYAPINSNDVYTQACGRITRSGQKTVAVIVNISATALERSMYKRLKDKTALQGVLLDMVEKGGAL